MNNEQQKDEIILMVKKAIANNCTPFNDSDEFVELDCSDVDNIAEEVYEALYNAGYRKVPEEAVVLTKEELVKIMESGYVYDTTRGNKVNIIEMAREIERKETAKEILNMGKKLYEMAYHKSNAMPRLIEWIKARIWSGGKR